MKLRKKKVTFEHTVIIKHTVTREVAERLEEDRFDGYVFDDTQALNDALEEWSDEEETGLSLPTVTWWNIYDTDLISSEDIKQ